MQLGGPGRPAENPQLAASGPRATLLFRLNLLLLVAHDLSLRFSSLKACRWDTPVAWKWAGAVLAERPTGRRNQKEIPDLSTNRDPTGAAKPPECKIPLLH
jgi:hypothetical protein